MLDITMNEYFYLFCVCWPWCQLSEICTYTPLRRMIIFLQKHYNGQSMTIGDYFFSILSHPSDKWEDDTASCELVCNEKDLNGRDRWTTRPLVLKYQQSLFRIHKSDFAISIVSFLKKYIACILHCCRYGIWIWMRIKKIQKH